MERPPIELEVFGKTVKWTYGLSNDIQRLVPDPGVAMTSLLQEPFTRDYIIRRVLTEKKGVVTDENELISYDEIDELTSDDTLKLLDWVMRHLLYFFANSAASIRRQGEAFKAALPQSAPSNSGSLG